jgi:hypothetical protein
MQAIAMAQSLRTRSPGLQTLRISKLVASAIRPSHRDGWEGFVFPARVAYFSPRIVASAA